MYVYVISYVCVHVCADTLRGRKRALDLLELELPALLSYQKCVHWEPNTSWKNSSTAEPSLQHTSSISKFILLQIFTAHFEHMPPLSFFTNTHTHPFLLSNTLSHFHSVQCGLATECLPSIQGSCFQSLALRGVQEAHSIYL